MDYKRLIKSYNLLIANFLAIKKQSVHKGFVFTIIKGQYSDYSLFYASLFL